MAATTTPRKRMQKRFETLADLLASLGGVSPERIGFDPPPGTATEKDVVRWLHAPDKRLYELVDGTLVEKAMSTDASFVGGQLIKLLGNFSDANGDLGMILGADGGAKLFKGLVRFPDVSFTRWDRLPGGLVPKQPLVNFAPDLAVEVLSPSNTPGEIDRKLGEYFRAGVLLAWVVDPDTHTVRVHTTADSFDELGGTDSLDGGDVLPGFRVPVAKLFGKLPPAKSVRPRRGKKGG